MAGRTADSLLLSDDDRPELERLMRTTSAPAGLALRARIVVLAADGTSNHEIADKVGVSRSTVNLWRGRYATAGMAGLFDQDRPGRPSPVDQSKIINETSKPPPKNLGVTHRSSRLLAGRLGLRHATVAASWKSCGIRP